MVIARYYWSVSITLKGYHLLCTHMCYVGGMVEDTTRETTVHEFEPQHMRIYLDLFFSKGPTISYRTLRPVLNRPGQPVPAGATGTKGCMRLVLMKVFLAVRVTKVYRSVNSDVP